MELLRDAGAGRTSRRSRHPDPDQARPRSGCQLAGERRLCLATAHASRATVPRGGGRFGRRRPAEPGPGEGLAHHCRSVVRQLHPIRQPNLRHHRARAELVARTNQPADCADQSDAGRHRESYRPTGTAKRPDIGDRQTSEIAAYDGWLQPINRPMVVATAGSSGKMTGNSFTRTDFSPTRRTPTLTGQPHAL